MALTFEEYIAEKKRQGFITPPSIEEVYNELRARIETLEDLNGRNCDLIYALQKENIRLKGDLSVAQEMRRESAVEFF